MKNLLAAGIMLVFIATEVSAQTTQPTKSDIKIKKIDVELSLAPRYTTQGQSIPRQAQSDQNRKWLVVEAELESGPDWVDEVTVKFFVVANYGSTAKEKPADNYDILATSVTVVNMQRNVGTGQKNIVPVFMDANTVKRYGATGIQQFIPQVAVQVIYKGTLQDTHWMTGVQKDVRFWETKQPRAGVLLNLTQSPWSPAFLDHYEQVKPIVAGTPGY
ncbi:MAG: hypothetical protein HY360_11525 [Verrucomicrobia bacterium]|nr:hypothetical protein [Verrucomicrobiota bacterium]